MEEIHDNLATEKEVDITGSLSRQLELMEGKKCKLEEAIASIKSVLFRNSEEQDWDKVAEIVKRMQKD